MSDDLEKKIEKKLERAYDAIVESLREALSEVEHKGIPILKKGLDKAKAAAVKLEGVTQKEAEKAAQFVKKDLATMLKALGSSTQEISTAMKGDWEITEQRFWEQMLSVADKASLDYVELQHHLEEDIMYHTGEITNEGLFTCLACGQSLHIEATAPIPPCPKCHESKFTKKLVRF